MKYAEPRPFADPDVAARRLVEIASTIEPVQKDRIYVELGRVLINALRLLRGTNLKTFARSEPYRFCAGFWTPAIEDSPHAQLAGVQKAPRHEVAGSWALAGQRVLWGFGVGADLDDRGDAGRIRPACLHGQEIGRAQ
jgi:hypothetical protein